MNKSIILIYRVFLIFFFIFWSNLGFTQNNQDAIDSLVIQNDSIKAKRITLNAYPYAFYTPETQAALGAGGILLFYTQDSESLRPSKIGFGAQYTSNKQYKFSLNSSIYFNDNKLVVKVPVSFGYSFDKFWGIGNNTPENGSEGYFREDFKVQLQVQVPPLLFFADRTGFILEYSNTKIVDNKDNLFLNNQTINGYNAGELFGVGFNFVWDGRDNLFYPTSGHFQSMKFIVYPEPSDYVFTSVEIDVRYYKKLSKNQVLATNFYFNSVSSDAPFYKLPALGGQNRMRGYFQGRYRDKNYMTLQTEYRQFFSKKFGFVAFAGIGDVSSEVTDLKLNSLKYSLGGGLRYLFNKKENVNLRMDFGIGKDGNTGIYFGIEEAF
jgi:outer membrane protein assembly factor BamA